MLLKLKQFDPNDPNHVSLHKTKTFYIKTDLDFSMIYNFIQWDLLNNKASVNPVARAFSGGPSSFCYVSIGQNSFVLSCNQFIMWNDIPHLLCFYDQKHCLIPSYLLERID